MKTLLINLLKAFVWGAVCFFVVPLSCACASTPLDLPTAKPLPATKPVAPPMEPKQWPNLRHLFSPKHGEHLRLSDRQGLT